MTPFDGSRLPDLATHSLGAGPHLLEILGRWSLCRDQHAQHRTVRSGVVPHPRLPSVHACTGDVVVDRCNRRRRRRRHSALPSRSRRGVAGSNSSEFGTRSRTRPVDRNRGRRRSGVRIDATALDLACAGRHGGRSMAFGSRRARRSQRHSAASACHPGRGIGDREATPPATREHACWISLVGVTRSPSNRNRGGDGFCLHLLRIALRPDIWFARGVPSASRHHLSPWSRPVDVREQGHLVLSLTGLLHGT